MKSINKTKNINKTFVVAVAVLMGGPLSAVSAAQARTLLRHSLHHHRLYNYAPSGAYPQRGGPGPRVQGGTGTGIGAER